MCSTSNNAKGNGWVIFSQCFVLWWCLQTFIVHCTSIEHDVYKYRFCMTCSTDTQFMNFTLKFLVVGLGSPLITEHTINLPLRTGSLCQSWSPMYSWKKSLWGTLCRSLGPATRPAFTREERTSWRRCTQRGTCWPFYKRWERQYSSWWCWWIIACAINPLMCMYIHVIPHTQVQPALRLEPPSLANHIPSARLGSWVDIRNLKEKFSFSS